MPRSDRKPRTKRELMIEAWNRLGCAAVGARELREIQRAIQEQLGEAAAASPAAIARVLADVGAELRHPEVIEFDARWRESQIESDAGELDAFSAGKPLRLKKGEAFIKKLERLRKRSERAGDQRALRRVRELGISARQVAQSLTNNRALAEPVRAEQAEIAEWLAVWIQTPNLFDEWLELRRRSPDFRKRFPTEKSS
ncbi:MAG TPA: hypothetical protein VHD88_08190 [Pyrinomonadaceae bacterium]|nr:hypothetical protein [Pyrinomonadaceae bacterium]